MANQSFENILKYFISGILATYLLIFGLRPSVMNPDVIVDIFEHKWVLLLLLMINYYIALWDYRNGILFLLIIIAIIFDYIVFIDKKAIKRDNNDKHILNYEEKPYVMNSLDPTLFETHLIKQLQNLRQKYSFEIDSNFNFF